MSRVGLICFTFLVALHADAQAVVTASGGQGIGPDLHVAWTNASQGGPTMLRVPLGPLRAWQAGHTECVSTTGAKMN